EFHDPLFDLGVESWGILYHFEIATACGLLNTGFRLLFRCNCLNLVLPRDRKRLSHTFFQQVVKRLPYLCYNRSSRMAKTEREYRQDIIDVGRLVFQKGWVAANDGNITIRLDQDRILATPTQICKGMMDHDDLIVVDMKGRKIEGRRECTSEIAMHLTVYEMRPDIRSVVHAHPPVATGYATAGKALNLALLPEVIIGLGCVPLADYGLPGTPELTKPMLPLIPKYDAIMMGNHGAVCYGKDVYTGFFKMETVEH